MSQRVYGIVLSGARMTISSTKGFYLHFNSLEQVLVLYLSSSLPDSSYLGQYPSTSRLQCRGLLIRLDSGCSKCERQGHNLFHVDNTAQVRGGLRGTLGEE